MRNSPVKLIFIVLESEVVTPSTPDKNRWLFAKGSVESAAFQHCSAKIHVAGVHLTSFVYCLTFRRHLSKQHPLYDFFLYHCEGTVPHITTAFLRVLPQGSAFDFTSNLGTKGSEKIILNMYKERNYEKMTFDSFIKVSLLISF